MPKAKYVHNKNIFDVIDSADKAYWLAFIWGDGNATKRPNGKGSYVKIGLSAKDIGQLQKFKEFISATNPIKVYDIKTGFNTEGQEARMTIYGEYLADVLINKYGISKDRIDFSLVVNNTPIEFHKDLIRGLIDSDGGIPVKEIKYKTVTRKEYSVGMIASKSVLDFMVEYFYKNGLTETEEYTYVKRHKGRDGNMLNLRITGNFVTAHILQHIYLNAKEYLDRKREVAFGLFEYINDYVREKGCRRLSNGQIEHLDTQNDYIKLEELTC